MHNNTQEASGEVFNRNTYFTHVSSNSAHVSSTVSKKIYDGGSGEKEKVNSEKKNPQPWHLSELLKPLYREMVPRLVPGWKASYLVCVETNFQSLEKLCG